MPATELPRARHLLSTTARITLRILPRVIAFAVCVTAAIALVAAGTLLIATPSIAQLRDAIEAGTSSASLTLLIVSGWGAIPLATMAAGWLATLGFAMHAADAVARSSRLQLWRAVTVTLTRVPAAAVAAIAHLLAVLLAVALGPLIWLVGVAWRVARAVRAPRHGETGDRREHRIPTRALTIACIPFAPAALLTVRWALLLPEVFVGRVRVRHAFAASWRRTAGAPGRVATVAVTAVVGALVVSWGLILLGVWAANPQLELALQIIASALVAPIPPVAGLVLYRALGGARSPALVDDADAPARSARPRAGQAVPVGLSALLVLTLMHPPSAAMAAPALAASDPASSIGVEPTTTTFDDASPFDPWVWEFGDTSNTITGQVTAAGGPVSGQVQLWALEFVNTPPVRLGSPLVLDDGRFSLDRLHIRPSYLHIWAEYLGDAVHAGSVSAEQRVAVQKRLITGQIEVLTPAGGTVVGGNVRIRYTPDPHGRTVPGFPLVGDLEVIDPNSMQVLYSGPLISQQPLELSFPLTKQTTILMISVDSPYYWASTGEGTVVYAEPVSTWTTITAQGAVVPGSDLTVYADVSSTASYPYDGSIVFRASNVVGGAPVEVATVPVGGNGRASHTFCVATNPNANAAGGCADPGFLVGQGALALQVQAEFVPSEPAQLQAHSGSISAWQWVGLQNAIPGGDGGCVVIDATSRVGGAAGPVAAPTITTPTSCVDQHGRQGYLARSALTLRAATAAGYEFVEWRAGSSAIGSGPTHVWTLPATTPTEPITLTAEYRLACFAVDVRVSGHADVAIASSTSCTRADGRPGAVSGTQVRVTSSGNLNATTGENDSFLRASAGSTPVSTHQRGSEVRFTITRDTVLELEYGPVCRSIVTHRSALRPDDLELLGTGTAPTPTTLLPELVTAPNCSNASGTGYLRGSTVVIRSALDDPNEVVTAWRVDGVIDPALGAPAELNYRVGDAASTTLEYDMQRCFRVETSVTAQGRVLDPASAIARAVTASSAPNCPDGSERYLEGTPLVWDMSHPTLALGGWSQSQAEPDGTPIAGTETRHVGTPHPFTVTEDRAYVLQLYLPSECSTITVRGGLRLDDLTFADDRCGPGRYYDQAKAALPADGQYIGERLRDDGSPVLWADGTPNLTRYEGPMLLGHYVSHPQFAPTLLEFTATGALIGVQGTVKMTQRNPAGAKSWSWTDTVPLSCYDDRCSVLARGDVVITLSECQGIDATVNITVAGDESETVYHPDDLGLEDFDWVTSTYLGCGGRLEWTANEQVTLLAQAPAAGFEFLDWGTVQNMTALELITEQDPAHNVAPVAVRVRTDGASPDLSVELHYRVHCGLLVLGEGISIRSPAPTCPGAARDEPLFVIGTFVEVVAQDQNANGRHFEGFRGAIPGTRSTVQSTGGDLYGATFGADHTNIRYHSALVIVDALEKEVWGYYQYGDTFFEGLASSLPKVGKFSVGLVSLGLTAAIGLCAPCSAALAVLQASEFLVRLIPGGGDIFGNVLAMLNPLNFMECSTKWGFDTLDAHSGGPVTELEFTTAGFKIEAGLGTRMIKSIIIDEPDLLAKYEKYTTRAKGLGVAMTFAYGLWDNRIHNFDFSGASASELRNTDAYTQCLANTWGDPTR